MLRDCAVADVLQAKQFTGRGIIEANPRSRAAGQFGAQKGDRASKRLTRRPATHNHPSDSRARLQRDCGLATDGSRPFARTEHGQSADAAAVTASDWSRSRTGRGADTFAVADWSRTDRGCGHRRGHLPGQIAVSPRPLRGRKNLVLTRSKACPVQNR